MKVGPGLLKLSPFVQDGRLKYTVIPSKQYYEGNNHGPDDGFDTTVIFDQSAAFVWEPDVAGLLIRSYDGKLVIDQVVIGNDSAGQPAEVEPVTDPVVTTAFLKEG